MRVRSAVDSWFDILLLATVGILAFGVLAAQDGEALAAVGASITVGGLLLGLRFSTYENREEFLKKLLAKCTNLD